MMMLDNSTQRGIIAISLFSLRESLPEARLEPDECVDIVEALKAALEDSSVGRALKGDRVLALDILGQPEQVQALVDFEVDLKNPLHRAWLDVERIGVLDMHEKFREWAEQPFPEIADELEKQPETYVRSKPMPLPLTVVLTPGTTFIEGQARLRAELLQAALAVELEDPRKSTGAYPDSLEELQPKYLDRLPLDPFSGKPFRYTTRPGGYLVYSLGPNGEDDGGKYDRDQDLDDIVWTVEPESGGEEQ